MVNYRENRKLFNLSKTLGDKCESLGISVLGWSRNGRYNNPVMSYDFMSQLPTTPGAIVVDISDYAMNSSSYERDGETVENVYAAYVGTAHVNKDGQGTMSSQFDCIVVPARKRFRLQDKASRTGFEALLKKHGKQTDRILVLPGSIAMFDSKENNGGVPTRRILVIEADTICGHDTKGKDFLWTILDYPGENFRPAKDEEGAEETQPQAARPRRSRVATDTAPEQGAEADAELVHAG